MATDILLRSARPGDAGPISACVRDAYARYANTALATPAPIRDDYHRVIQDKAVWIAEINGVIAGVLVLSESEEGFLLDNIAVASAFNGRGLGRRLLDLAEEQARIAGYASIYLYTQVGMDDNVAIYQKMGYVEYDRRWDGDFHRIYLRKALSAKG